MREAAAGSVSIALDGPELGRSWYEPICDVYYAVFSQPPFPWSDYEANEYRSRILGFFENPTFGVVVAYTYERLVGFAYGYQLPASTRWWGGLTGSVPAEITQERDGRTFALIDFAVLERWRGKGIGRQMHDALLGSRNEERATLTVEPENAEVQAIYERWGWQRLGRLEGGETSFAAAFDVFLLPLPLHG